MHDELDRRIGAIQRAHALGDDAEPARGFLPASSSADRIQGKDQARDKA
jgi:hypothetical protein